MRDDFPNDPAEIEAELARERTALTGKIDSLRQSLTPDTLLEDALQFAKARIAPITQTVDHAVRSNPLAAAMAAVGVAWLILGRKTKAATPTPALAGSIVEAMSRWEDEGGPLAPFPETDQAWIAETDLLRSRGSAALSDLDMAARLRLRPAADLARERAGIVTDIAASTTRAMLRGLEGLPAAARQRVLDARQRAYAAQSAVAAKGTSMIEDHPLIAGAIALATGAAVAKALPLTNVENRLLGPERDRLLADARDMLLSERTRFAGTSTAV